jgi:putative nucleotidyltransferase with HDIG domain
MTANQLAAKVQHLAPASHSAFKLITLLGRSAINNDEIVRVLKYDTSLTAKLLRTCNSVFFGFDEPVASVEQAVLVLGHKQILRILFAIAFNSTMTVPLPGYAADANELWHHSLVTAFNCEHLAQTDLMDGVEPSVAFTAGLLHDIGKLALDEVLGKDTQTAIRSRIELNGQSCAEAEREIIGTDHAQVGASLLQMWKLPPEIIEAVENHHRPMAIPQLRLSALVHVADCLAHIMGSSVGWDSFAIRVDGGVARALELTPDRTEQLLITAHGSLEEVELLEAMK